MAIFDGKYIKGIVGDLVFKKHGKKQLVQTKPFTPEVNRTIGSKHASAIFGVASKLACDLRAGLNAIITNLYDGSMVSRLNTEVLYSLREARNPETGAYLFTANSFYRLNGFEFNALSPLKNSLFVQPEINVTDHLLQINLPAINIPHNLKFPDEATACKLNVTTSMYDLTYGHRHEERIRSIEIIRRIPGATTHTVEPQQWDFEIKSGCLCIAVMSLQFIKQSQTGDVIINSKTFNPSVILKAVMAAGTVDFATTKKWPKIDFKNPVN